MKYIVLHIYEDFSMATRKKYADAVPLFETNNKELAYEYVRKWSRPQEHYCDLVYQDTDDSPYLYSGELTVKEVPETDGELALQINPFEWMGKNFEPEETYVQGWR